MIKKLMDETKKGFMQNIGDLSFKEIDETSFEFSIEIKENFLNTGGIAHGGFIATIADTGMGNAAHIAAGNKRCVTINLDIKFISAGKLNDKLVGKVKILKKTKTLVFISSEIFNSEKIVASASGVWKIL
ncbi:MAG: thioesterase [Candidatus Pelagibacter sp. TMED273]|nr:MAG: thioesterase [Candidatus Pelagibacter sp. TMED273]|tara:strand:+ start:927 stop:1316 length:390 start_codon:yes stop_codon:yes gene_type:complete